MASGGHVGEPPRAPLGRLACPPAGAYPIPRKGKKGMMDALDLLKGQHKEINALFDRFENSDQQSEKLRLFEQIADMLAIHTMIEEKHFYPAARSKGTREDLAEAYDEHKEVKKLLLHAMKSTSAPGFDGLVAAIRGGLEHHIHEEETNLFPKVKKLLDKKELEDIRGKLDTMTEELRKKGNARTHISLTPVKAPA